MNRIAWLCAVVMFMPSLSGADPFNEFRIPEHSWQSGTASFSGYALRYDVAHGSNSLRELRNQSGRFGASMRLERGFDSERRAHGWSLAVVHDLGLTRWESLTRYQYPPSPVREGEAGWSRWPSGDLYLRGFLRSYRAASKFGLDLSANGFARGSEVVRRRDHTLDGFPSGYREESRSNSQDNRYGYAATLAATIGHGVVRNATVVEAVHVLEQRLMEAGVLDRELSTSTRAQLAGLLVVAPRLASAHDRPGRFVWREVERALREDGSLRDGKLNSYAQLYALQSYRVGPDLQRTTGHFAGLTVQASHEHELSRFDERTTARRFQSDTLMQGGGYGYSSRIDAEVNRVLVGPAIEWHRPVGWRWQWDLSSRVLFVALPGQNGLRTESTVGGAWLVADRWQARAYVLHLREYLNRKERLGAAPVDSWGVRTVAALDYFLEDHLRLTAEYREGQDRNSRVTSLSPSIGNRFTRQDLLTIGLTYRFLGRVSAPGLMETMRPL